MSQDLERSGYVLVVGKEGKDRTWIEEALLRGGLTVASASEAETLAVHDLMPPRLVVIDDASGSTERLGTQRRLRAHPSLQGVPVLVLAYDGDVDSYTTAITKGAAAYLVKPAGAEEVVAAARRLSGWSGYTERTERRRRVRRPLLMKVDVQVRSRRAELPGQMVDASSGGCRLELGEPLAAGESVRVILHAHDDTTHLALGGEVRWCRSLDGVHAVGVRFTGTTALLAPKLLGFVPSGVT